MPAMALLAVACSSPTQATVIDPGGPAITCPAPPAAAQTLDGNPVAVSYAFPTVTGGATPLTGPTCTPPSGGTFPQGTTTVTCIVSDVKARAASCMFAVAVLGPPKLLLTRFFAFGDSITAGEIPSEGEPAFKRFVDPYRGYPIDLTRDLSNRYQTQQPAALNAGVSAETTANGLVRLPTVIAMGNALGEGFQVMLLMEGANDIPAGPSSFQPAVSNLQAMIDIAKGAGLRVYLANLPPQNANASCSGSNAPPGCFTNIAGAPYVTAFNAMLPGLAASEQIPFVDVYAAFNGNVTTLIDFDGLHPTAAGYQVIADTFFKQIQATLEIPVATTTTSRTSLLSLQRRR
jgi:lysophospholipase L1-like esterase